MIRNVIFSIFFFSGIIIISLVFLPAFFLPQKIVLIGGKLIEVNVLSPGTITDINKLNNTKIQRKIVDYLELVVEEISDRKNKSELIKIETDETIGD